MRSRMKKNYGITHSLTPIIDPSPPKDADSTPNDPKYCPLYTRNTFLNPLTQRSRKHRLLEEKNTDIERENRRLYEKLRKIKLKNAFQSEQRMPLPEQTFTNPVSNSTSKPLSLPIVPSLSTTPSQLNSILNDRKTFVSKYFEQLAQLRNKLPKKTEQLGNFICNGWKIRVLLLDEEFLLLRGRQGTKQLTKKYRWEKVRGKMGGGLEEWVRFKFQFEN